MAVFSTQELFSLDTRTRPPSVGASEKKTDHDTPHTHTPPLHVGGNFVSFHMEKAYQFQE